ncbi:hypothetical protein J7W19_02465 [Streptomyces mobaraensis NBRC 13819 = DSM 40847]|uniref:DUF7144 domain-containing protein n=2 Tax=Streptomyces mobaraensis TaxID=35621 RepID=A0A5N5W564_STRMB|nr:hypothetical protein [Streptomyces mobaraensis]EME97638.1 hypothetical protein H340_25502 [Streptomyces mobaraensis NBRC 13819 = DSM 40847]KAB7841634.1 hypothetical protein FRZ00_20230 [Streptomyces mobaraensis]QTT72448.1 hypothetical protein J7W19_02465 [Streptomyces mobaraensis NBRC 13819 = DSM 40847]
MSHSSQPHTTQHHSEKSLAAAAGLTVFAAVMLLIDGFLNVLRGISAIVHDTVFVNAPNYVYKFNVAGWGWVHLFLGIAAIMVGVGLFKVSAWARVLGIVIASLILIANFLSLPYFPLWSVVVMATCAFVIWALCVVRHD